MNTAVLGGLVEQWVWRCELVATEYQLRPATDLKSEVDKLIGEAEEEARRLNSAGVTFLARVEGRLALTAHVAGLSDLLFADEPAEPALNAAGRVEALRALTGAFGHAADRLGARAA
jgi:hypothetical protein